MTTRIIAFLIVVAIIFYFIGTMLNFSLFTGIATAAGVGAALVFLYWLFIKFFGNFFDNK